MNCYSNYSPKSDICRKCKLKKYCIDSGDIPLIIDKNKRLFGDETNNTSTHRKEAFNSDKKEYTKAEMLELIAFMVALDENTITLIGEKLNDPTISIAELGKRRNITRQGIHKYLKQRCEKHPELSVVFQNKKNKHKKTFLEVVCKIKQQTQKLESKRTETNLNYYSNLTCLSQNLDLSRMSIGKDIKR